jgi:hypothetical protein
MNTFIRLSGSIAALAGIVHEGILAKAIDPYFLSHKSLVLIVMYSVLLFVVNLRSFKKIGLNIGPFHFTEINLSSGASFAPVKDRSGDMFKIIKLKSLEVTPPKLN